MLDLYLEGLDAPSHSARPLIGAIEVRNVSFRYAETEPYVLENATLRIEPGEFVAITGPSGGGKTTLMKLMLGLFEPDTGEILIDGYTMGALGVANLRKQVGVVMQDDQLLSGSIQENILFFDTVVDPTWVQRCAEAAGIHNDVMRMPMGYHTLVGDMGGALSGGQRQRLLLARALYRKPRILFLDEGTSHLDPAMEEQVNAAIAKLAITRVTIAHRPQTVAAADRILVVHQGRVSEVTRPSTAPTTAIAARPVQPQVGYDLL
jgi:ATP-binding cassette, subfamily B, bacterial CvaB/MchF/RaxB